MTEAIIVKKLETLDRELHSIINELKPKESKTSLKEIRELMNSNIKSDTDPTDMIREMRNRKYDP